MGNRASIIFLDDTQTKEYLENQEGFNLKAGDKYIYTHWNGGVESVCAFVDFARFLGIHKLEVGKKYIEFYAMLRNFFYDIDSHYEYGIFGEYNNRHGTIELETLDGNKNVNEGLYFNNKPCVISDSFKIISYTSEELELARKDGKYQEIFNGLKKQYAKIETQICESVIDGRKLAETLSYSEAYKWFINDNNGSYSEDKYQLGIVLVNNLRFMSEEYDNNAEYGIYEAWTKESIDAVCKMLDAMFEFCNKRQIKYINLN
jgi:hypothetical protein